MESTEGYGIAPRLKHLAAGFKVQSTAGRQRQLHRLPGETRKRIQPTASHALAGAMVREAGLLCAGVSTIASFPASSLAFGFPRNSSASFFTISTGICSKCVFDVFT